FFFESRRRNRSWVSDWISDVCSSDLRALARGYQGTSHKNCKGVFKGIANACLVESLRREPGGEKLVMSGEDLANIGPVALLQDRSEERRVGKEGRTGEGTCQ